MVFPPHLWAKDGPALCTLRIDGFSKMQFFVFPSLFSLETPERSGSRSFLAEVSTAQSSWVPVNVNQHPWASIKMQSEISFPWKPTKKQSVDLFWNIKHPSGASVPYLMSLAVLAGLLERGPSLQGLPPKGAAEEGNYWPDISEFQLRFFSVTKLGSHKSISSFLHRARTLLSSDHLLCPFSFGQLSSWHLLRKPLILACAGQPFALRCNESACAVHIKQCASLYPCQRYANPQCWC